MIRKLTALAASLLLLLGLTACDSGAPSESGSESGYKPVTAFGVSFSEAPGTIVSLSAATTEMLGRLGLQSAIIGRTDGCTVPQGIEQVESVGSEDEPDIDAVLGLAPELVITRKPLSKAQLEALNGANIKALVVPATSDLRELKSYYASLASVFFGVEKGAQLAKNALSDAYCYANAMLDVLKDSKESFAYFTKLKQNVATPDTFAGSLLGYLGANKAEGAGNKADLEKLAAANPALLFVSKPYALENLAADPYWSRYAAVTEGRVYSLDATLFDRQSPEAFAMVFEQAKLIYPEQAEALDAAVTTQREKQAQASQPDGNNKAT